MKTLKHISSFGILLFFLVLFGASKTQKQAIVVEPIKTPDYSYVSGDAKNKTGVTLALVTPIYGRNFKFNGVKLFEDFKEYMGRDFEQMITNRGYTLRGPFAGLDDMVYDDKNSCPLFIQPEIVIDIDMSNVITSTGTEKHFDANGRMAVGDYYTFKGSITLSGRINMLFGEPFSKEKIKSLSIPLQQKTVTFESSTHHRNNDFTAVLMEHKDAKVINPIIMAMEDYYKASFSTAYNHLDPQEVNIYINDAKKARETRK